MYLHFVSHTHWDREWYETFDAFRFRLAQLIDHLLDVLRKDPEYRHFLLDGQTIVIEDYLAIKPYRKQELAKFIKEGRISVGPWYVLTDEFLISGETHIRNLLFGKRLMQEFGTQNAIGYLPDSFGHIAQMPQILKKSGIRYATFWRGVPREVRKSEFIWKSPDGSSVLTIYMPFGYGIAANLPDSREELLQRVRGLIEKLAPFATTPHLLLMNGSDHIEPDAKLSEKLALLREELKGEHIVLHSNLLYLFRKVEEEASWLPTYEGEWRADDVNYLLGGTLSTRVYLKQKHTRLSYLVERYLEPLYTLLMVFGIPYPEDFLNYLWKLLLENSPHDSICGCGIDEVHEEMMQRYRRIEDVSTKLLIQAREHLESLCEGDEDVVVVLNPHPYTVNAYLESEIYLKKKKIQEVDFAISKIQSYDTEEEPLLPSLELVGQEEVIVPEIRESSWVTFMETPRHTLPEIFKAQRYVIGFPVRNLPPFGSVFFKIVPKHGIHEHTPKVPKEWLLENEFYRLFIDARGHTLLCEKATGREFLLGPVFEDGADAGDEYDYSPCEEDTIIRSDTVIPEVQWMRYDRYVQAIRLTHMLHLPKALAPDRRRRSEEKIPTPIATEIRLTQGSKIIEFTMTLENRVFDHRLRVLFFAPFTTNYHFADAHFALLKRKNEQRTQPQNDFVLLEDTEHVFVVFNEGLREYEIIPENGRTCVAITLLRAVGWLSRDDLLTRKGHAGWGLPTEGAQCQGIHRFRLGVLFEPRSDSKEFSPYKEARLFNNPPLLFQIRGTIHSPLNGWSFCTWDNEAIILSALKKREGRHDIVLRAYNPTGKSQSFRIVFNFPVLEIWQLSLLEEEVHFLAQGNAVEGVLGPYEIATFGIVWKRKEGNP
ncbi:alpha-mannosidase [Candidatus Caldatribacterium sp.]|uniref:alpha-mannosidase n=1 Tax=Candidatus Caldatribacterium sp. TaxID=2282143 RepID=UPI002997486A|nr:glycosyl hydrolase-related protein [Candidatus Caldatribacterium sp.]MDW8081345.1 glycoside hydrolase family 38 C-terminal domain-containing protein [Candidatus Calescibacterium sp.]